MTRIAFTMMGGRNWMGGYNYLLNLLRVLTQYHSGKWAPVLFFGTDIDSSDIAPFEQVPCADIVRTPLMNRSRKPLSLALSLVIGADPQVRALFRQHGIEVVFESAQFFGARLGIPVIAWMPDFQHRVLPHFFTFASYLKRELGFRAQVAAGRTIMVSSDDSRKTCETFYPATRGKIHIVRFAISTSVMPSYNQSRAVADHYTLPANYVFLPNQFWKHKNHLLVVHALCLLRSRGHSVVVAATGKQFDNRNPEYFSEVKALIESSGLTECFRILGMIPYEHIAPLACASLALLNPSNFEGWSTTVEEALSWGVPLLLSDLPVHREQAGLNALYFDPRSAASLAAALETLYCFPSADPKLRERDDLSESAHRVKRFADSFAVLVGHAKGIATGCISDADLMAGGGLNAINR